MLTWLRTIKQMLIMNLGTVVAIGGNAEVTAVNEAGSHAVVGVVSTNPAYLMNAELDSEHVVSIALRGRVS